MSSTGGILSTKTPALPSFNQVSVPFDDYFNLETGLVCGRTCFDRVTEIYDLKFAAGGGAIRARMWWNEQYTNMSLVYDKSFSVLTLADVSNYYFCDYVGDSNVACVNVDTPPIGFVGVYHTSEGNYYAVEYISEDDTSVTFKYKKL